MNGKLVLKGATALFLLILCLLPATNVQAQSRNSFYVATSQLLKEHVQEGQVNYSALQKNKEALENLIQQVGAYNLAGAPAAARKAFYLNAYNLLVLHQVLRHYPLKSVMDVPGFFDKQQFTVAGEQLTLNQLEKRKLMVPHQDARVHFALVCAARSCPPLLNTAYTPETVEEQLEAQTKKALQDAAFIRVQPKNRKVLVSELFNWYRDDFLRQNPSVAAYINRYRNTPLPAGYVLGYYTYDWSLNDKR